MAARYKYYVYQFFMDDVCVYVGKGCGSRFSVQSKRFSEFYGKIIAYFVDEKSALEHEKSLIKELAPSHNKAMNDGIKEPWKYSLLPEDKDFYTWCNLIGTRQMAARILLSKPWSVLKKNGIEINNLLSKVDYFGKYHGCWC